MGRGRAQCGVRYRNLQRRHATTYEVHRERCLEKLGYSSYRQYLRSELWKAIRDEKIRQTPLCELCSSKAQCVHHISYKLSVLIGRNMRKLVSLCNECHTKIEFHGDGRKRGFESAMKRTRHLLRKAGVWEKHKSDGISSDRDA